MTWFIVYLFSYFFIEIIYLARFKGNEKFGRNSYWDYSPYFTDVNPWTTWLTAKEWILQIVFMPVVAILTFLTWIIEE